MKRIYLSPPNLDGRERELLFEAYASNWITTLGPQVDAFENLFLRFETFAKIVRLFVFICKLGGQEPVISV